jgi:RNA polymerase sigma-70 factor (ECF subfamily)
VKDPQPALKQAAVAGDRAAIDRLFRELYQPVFGFCFSMTRSQAEAEDLTQLTFLRAFRHLWRFRAAEPIGPWIMRIAHNLFISQLRARRPHLDLDDPGQAPVPAQEPQPDAVALSHEVHHQVRLALASLPPRAQAVLVLRYQQQLSYEEIAAVIGKPVTTVTNRLYEARQQLAKVLTQLEGGGDNAVQLVGH